MGTSTWSNDFYVARETERKAKGTPTFHHDAVMKSTPTANRQVHAALDPKGKTRESRDSKQHPESLAVAVMFDVTGSMGGIPVQIQKELPRLMSYLVEHKFSSDPQVLFGAIGDAVSDRGPIQIGQFESGIEMDEDMGRLWLEGGGGGSKEESYELGLYFFARHTSIDCHEKRSKKGYLFIIGDEKPYPTVDRQRVANLFGDTLQENVKTEDIVKEAQEKYHVFFILPSGANHGRDKEVISRWQGLLGDNFLTLDTPAAIVETIAIAVATKEGNLTVGDALAQVKQAGASDAVLRSVAATFNTTVATQGVVRL